MWWVIWWTLIAVELLLQQLEISTVSLYFTHPPEIWCTNPREICCNPALSGGRPPADFPEGPPLDKANFWQSDKSVDWLLQPFSSPRTFTVRLFWHSQSDVINRRCQSNFVETFPFQWAAVLVETLSFHYLLLALNIQFNEQKLVLKLFVSKFVSGNISMSII